MVIAFRLSHQILPYPIRTCTLDEYDFVYDLRSLACES